MSNRAHKTVFILIFLLFPGLTWAQDLEGDIPDDQVITVPHQSVEFYFEPGVSVGIFNSSIAAVGRVLQRSNASLSLSGNLGWRSQYIHLFLPIQLHTVGAPSGTGSRAFEGVPYSLGLGVGYEWNLPLMTNIGFKVLNAGENQLAGGLGGFIGLSYFFSEKFKLNLQYETYSAVLTSGLPSSTTSVILLGVSMPLVIDYPIRHWRRYLVR